MSKSKTERLQISSHLDYYTMSFYRCNKPDDAIPQAFVDFRVDSEMNPFANYDRAYRLACGGILNLADDDHQGARLDLGGQALEALRVSGFKDDYLLSMLSSLEKKKRTTNVHYCFNIHGGGSVRHVLNLWDADRAVTRLRSNPDVQGKHSERRGKTVYFGSKNSDQRVVVYDKAAELGLLAEAWTRVELRLRDPHAGAFVIDADKSDAAISARSRLKSVLDFPTLRWWQVALEGDTIEPMDAREHKDKWRWWMNNQVMGSIQKHMLDAHDRVFLEDWHDRVGEMLGIECE